MVENILVSFFLKMAQKMITMRKFKDIGIQTGNPCELFIYLGNKKTLRTYFSSSYNQKVMSLNFGTSKSFIITKEIWAIILLHLDQINNIFKDDKQ
jgi:hypothetical protein